MCETKDITFNYFANIFKKWINQIIKSPIQKIVLNCILIC